MLVVGRHSLLQVRELGISLLSKPKLPTLSNYQKISLCHQRIHLIQKLTVPEQNSLMRMQMLHENRQEHSRAHNSQTKDRWHRFENKYSRHAPDSWHQEPKLCNQRFLTVVHRST